MKFQVQQINKQGKTAVLSGCIKFTDLLGKVDISYRDYDDEEKHLFYQRRVDDKRTKEIARYIQSAIEANLNGDTSPIFPTSIILAFNEFELDISTIHTNDIIEFKKLPEGILIVDGQHRYSGMEYLYKQLQELTKRLFEFDESKILEYVKSYSFNCSILLNYDIWQQAQVFASVNFNQKKVNKSLFYDIYGFDLPSSETHLLPKQNEIYIAHKLVEHLQRNEHSPFSGFVKMLGTGKGFVSQAFLVEQFLKLLSSGHMWYDVTMDVKSGNKRNLQNYAAAELIYYLYALKTTFRQYWPDSIDTKPTVLCRTTGMGAMLRFMEDLHNCMNSELQEKLKYPNGGPIEYAQTLANVNLFFCKELSKLKDSEEILFDPEKGEFGSTGGSGLQSKLYNRIKEIWRSKN